MEDISEPWQSAHWGIHNDWESHRAWPRNPSPARGFPSWSSATDHDHDWLRRQVVQRRQRDFYDEMEDCPLGEFEAPNRDAHFRHLQSENDRFLAGIDIDDPPQFQSGTPVEEDSFLHWYPSGDATLSYPDTDGQLASINNINIWLIEARSPLLHMAFDHSRNGRPHLHLESLTRMTALPFLRFLYTGSYALTSASGDLYEDVPTSVLLHCQLYRLGDIYDLAELKQQAYLNVLRQCEFGCSSPEKPIDLCAAIRFLYQYLPDHTNVIEAILNYCVTCFLSHRLAHDQDFQQLAYELRPFHQKLCWMATERGQDDAEGKPLSTGQLKIPRGEMNANKLSHSCKRHHPNALPTLHPRNLRLTRRPPEQQSSLGRDLPFPLRRSARPLCKEEEDADGGCDDPRQQSDDGVEIARRALRCRSAYRRRRREFGLGRRRVQLG